jgi:hypothetical protein
MNAQRPGRFLPKFGESGSEISSRNRSECSRFRWFKPILTGRTASFGARECLVQATGTACLFSCTACVLRGELAAKPPRLKSNQPVTRILVNLTQKMVRVTRELGWRLRALSRSARSHAEVTTLFAHDIPIMYHDSVSIVLLRRICLSCLLKPRDTGLSVSAPPLPCGYNCMRVLQGYQAHQAPDRDAWTVLLIGSLHDGNALERPRKVLGW